MGFQQYRAGIPPTAADVRELKAFLESPLAEDEKALQHLLERHPALIGVLGFSDFLSEVPIFKTNENNEPELLDLRRRDRADLIASEPLKLETARRYAHIVELKGATRAIRKRSVGFRLSDTANEAIDQLHEYRSWLTTIPENKALLESMGWEIRWPQLSLIMGRDHEFQDNPGQLHEVKARLRSRDVELFTIDDVLERAKRHVDERIVVPNVVTWSMVSSLDLNALLRDADALRRMTPDQFEEFIRERLIAMGYDVDRVGTARTPDTGIDLIFRPKTGIPILGAVQVKHHAASDRKTGREIIDRMRGVLSENAFNMGMVVTNTTFTKDAKWSAETGHMLRLRDGQDVLRWMRNDFGDPDQTLDSGPGGGGEPSALIVNLTKKKKR